MKTKNRIFLGPLWAMAGVAWLAGFAGLAADNPPAATNAAVPAQAAPMALSYGVPDVLKLTDARVGDDVIVAFVEASGRLYNLSAAEIIYLREKGVSERVLTTMLVQRPKAKGTNAAPTKSPWSAPQFTPSETAPAQATPANTSAPSEATATTTYVVQNPAPVAYYDSYPRYGSILYPVLSFAVGFGTGFYFGGYHGDYHHGGYHGWHH